MKPANTQYKHPFSLFLSTLLVTLATFSIPQASAATEIYFIHNDHLGTPAVVTDKNQTVVWEAHQKPFGEKEVTTNTLDNDARFPGQYLDRESGMHYNYFRDYDPTIGRYIQSDPIGLQGGINTYAYVGGNPLKWFDPLGLDFGIGVDSAAAGGNGHTTLYTQSPSGNWNAYNQGAAGETSSGGGTAFLTGSNAPAGAGISPVPAPPSSAIIFPTTAAQDAAIMSCAVASVNDHNSGASSYNLYSNNCTDAVVDVLSCAGISFPNPIFTVRPNSWIKLIPKSTAP